MMRKFAREWVMNFVLCNFKLVFFLCVFFVKEKDITDDHIISVSSRAVILEVLKLRKQIKAPKDLPKYHLSLPLWTLFALPLNHNLHSNYHALLLLPSFQLHHHHIF